MSLTNLEAFARTVRQFESANDYRKLVGGGQFMSFANHPALPPTSWPGITTKWGPSHAAGAYQFQPRTWQHFARKLNLHDFSPICQDQAFDEDLKEHKQYDNVVAGKFALAVKGLQVEWQSLLLVPEDKLQAFYESQGGNVT